MLLWATSLSRGVLAVRAASLSFIIFARDPSISILGWVIRGSTGFIVASIIRCWRRLQGWNRNAWPVVGIKLEDDRFRLIIPHSRDVVFKFWHVVCFCSVELGQQVMSSSSLRTSDCPLAILKPETTKTKKGLKVSIYCIMHHGKSWSHASWHRYICIVTLTLFENCRSWLSSVPTLLRKAWLFREIPWCSVEVHQEGENQKTKRGKKLKINKQKLSALERCKLNVSPVIVFTEGRIVHSKARLTIGRAAAEIPC